MRRRQWKVARGVGQGNRGVQTGAVVFVPGPKDAPEISYLWIGTMAADGCIGWLNRRAMEGLRKTLNEWHEACDSEEAITDQSGGH